MAASFAGSRSVDERRRRRLASETDDAAAADSSLRLDSPPSAVQGTGEVSDQCLPDRFPLRKLISPKLWKHWTVVFLGLALVAGVLFARQTVAGRGELLGPGFARLFDPSAGPVARCFSSVLLLLSGQLALLIWWARARSLRDFAGRYRMWVWVAGAWLCFAFCLATGAHHAWSESLFWLCDVSFRNRESWCWLVPAALCGADLLWGLNREMRDCRSSHFLLWLAASLYLTAGVVTVDAKLRWSELALPATAMCGHVCLFGSMLLHARWVIHESPEPAEIRPFRFPIRLPHVRLPRWRKRLRRRADVNIETSDANAPPSESTDGQKPIEKVTSSRKSAKRSSKDAKSKSSKRSDQGLLKGLSKSERRKLRKQWREQERATAT